MYLGERFVSRGVKRTVSMRAVCWLAVEALLASGAASCGPSAGEGTSAEGEEDTPGEGVIECETFTFVDRDGVSRTEQEWYILSVINEKLRRFPEFAAAIGVSAVSECKGARAFAVKYDEYYKLHPEFDRRTREFSPGPPPRPPPGSPPDVMVDKIRNGTASFNYPVVRLIRLRTELLPATLCTGVFIAKNWIATAAHCMAHRPDGSPLQGYFDWQIDRAGQNGAVVPSARLTVKALQYPHPDWFGWIPGIPLETAPYHDLALLYLYAPWYDVLLPPNPANSAVRISARPPDADPAPMYGWGAQSPTDPFEASNTLRLGIGPPIVDIDALRFVGEIEAATDAQPCVGDSGGPWIRYVLAGGQIEQVMVGSLSGNITNLTHRCADPGDRVAWVRMDSQIEFIESSMRDWSGLNFYCQRFAAATGAGALDYARCWGAPCSSDNGCGPNERCAGLIAGRPDIMGQCLPR